MCTRALTTGGKERLTGRKRGQTGRAGLGETGGLGFGALGEGRMGAGVRRL